MSRISTRFEQLAKSGRKALIPYVTAGDPGAEVTQLSSLGDGFSGSGFLNGSSYCRELV